MVPRLLAWATFNLEMVFVCSESFGFQKHCIALWLSKKQRWPHCFAPSLCLAVALVAPVDPSGSALRLQVPHLRALAHLLWSRGQGFSNNKFHKMMKLWKAKHYRMKKLKRPRDPFKIFRFCLDHRTFAGGGKQLCQIHFSWSLGVQGREQMFLSLNAPQFGAQAGCWFQFQFQKFPLVYSSYWAR